MVQFHHLQVCVTKYYSFPPVGSAATLKTVLNTFQCRDTRKSVPHVVSVSGNVDRGLMAFLCNSLQQPKRGDSKQRLLQRKVIVSERKIDCVLRFC